MLPFLEPKKITSVIIARHGKPDIESNSEVESPESDLHPGLKAAAEDFLRAMESKSVIDLAKAFQEAFEICDSLPHEEYGQEEGEEK